VTGAALEMNVVVMTLLEYFVTVDGVAELISVVTEVTREECQQRKFLGSLDCKTSCLEGQ